MKTPPFLMAAALLFWGWENGLLIWSLLAGALLEGSRWSGARWEMRDSDLKRIFDLCIVSFAAAAFLLYSLDDRLMFVFRLAQWLPMCLLPIMLAQAYGTRETMPMSVFWWILRRYPNSAMGRRSLNISYCYFAVCLLAASASAPASISARAYDYFYAGMTLLVAAALASRSPRRVSRVAWIMLLAVAVNVGAFSHQGLRTMQDSMERALGGWLAGLFGEHPDPRECQTNIGGRPNRHSGKIIYRVRPVGGSLAPPLLREATWDEYKKERWLNSNADYIQIRIASGEPIKLMPPGLFSNTVEISTYVAGEEPIFAAPPTTYQLDEFMPVLKTNRLGGLRAAGASGLLLFDASFDAEQTIDCPPNDRDLLVPEVEKPVMAKIVAGLKLGRMSDRQKIRAIDHFFQTNGFTYSLETMQHRDPTWLGYFLNTSRSGHCEYFASATVLLLRMAGVPARYATGFIVQDSAKHGDTFLLRDRDRHAWTMAYHSESKHWEQLDTTPGGTERTAAIVPPWWEPLADTVSNLYFQFSKWRNSKTSYARYSSWLLVPMIFYLVARIVASQRRHRPPKGDGLIPTAWPGLDSELYALNRELIPAQLDRLPNEPLQSWQQRLERVFPDSDRLARIFHLHRSLRFDPRGLAAEQREALRAEVKSWLAEFTARHPTPR